LGVAQTARQTFNSYASTRSTMGKLTTSKCGDTPARWRANILPIH
jgi:hypothetical protein